MTANDDRPTHDDDDAAYRIGYRIGHGLGAFLDLVIGPLEQGRAV